MPKFDRIQTGSEKKQNTNHKIGVFAKKYKYKPETYTKLLQY